MTQQLANGSGPGTAAAAVTWQLAALHSALTGGGSAVQLAGLGAAGWAPLT